MRSMTIRSLAAFSAFTAAACAADYKAGVARVKITPEQPIYLSGYASRNHPSEGVLVDLWAKALAIADPKGNTVVIVTTALIGLPRSITDPVAARIEKQYGLNRAQIVFNSSHTHTGPVTRGNLEIMWDLSSEEKERIAAYAVKLSDALVAVAGAALGDLKPATLAYGEGDVGFAMNRREPTPKGVRIGVNPQGPRDTAVPVLEVKEPDGSLRAVLFGYACHNTTLGGDIYKITGDYAGYAQIAVEQAHPGATAMFMELCGADANPNPRGSIELAQQHGNELAAEVNRVLGTSLRPIRGQIRTAFQIVEPRFAPHTRETFEKLLNDPNQTRVRNARLMLKAYDEGRPIRSIPYPVQAIRFGKSLTLVALGGEVVVDYDLRIKREFNAAKEPIIVAGYSNDVMCYIPSLAVLKGGGYEPVDSMIYYGQPGPFADDVEEVIFGGVQSVMRRVGR